MVTGAPRKSPVTHLAPALQGISKTMTTYQLITHNSAFIKLLTTIETNDHQSAVEQLRDWAGANGYRLATEPGDVEATCTFMQNTGWFALDDFQDETDQCI
jgi:hypothetical protein